MVDKTNNSKQKTTTRQIIPPEDSAKSAAQRFAQFTDELCGKGLIGREQADDLKFIIEDYLSSGSCLHAEFTNM
jgi:hypothetical protein